MTERIDGIKNGLKAALVCAVIPVMLSACWEDLEEISGKIGGGALPAGANLAYTLPSSISFNMKYVPGGTFPTGLTDTGIPYASPQTISTPYWMAETEVTYQLWYAVRTWATNASVDHDGDGSTGDDMYTFANAGVQGSTGSLTDQHPVTTINWRAAMVWCNALTEYYNTNNGTDPDLDLVYYTDDGFTTPLRAATDTASVNSTAGSEDNPYVKATAKGFRLPECMEWELAARYRGTNTTNVYTGTVLGVDFSIMMVKWTKGDSASGATADFTDDLATGLVGVYNTTSTAAVKSKTTGYNVLGLYDMSGNVFEWCFDWHPQQVNRRVLRGGSWDVIANYMQVGFAYYMFPYIVDDGIGFRFVRTQ